MRLWPFRGRPAPPSADSSAFAIAELAPQLSGVLAVEQVRAEGHALAFGGRLLQSPPAAITSLQPRFRSFGYTPFLQASDGLTWVRALPFVEVEVPSRPRTNVVLFLLTVVSTFLAGALPLGHFPLDLKLFVQDFNPLSGVQFAGTLVAILGTHEFGHYFTARAYGASVSLPYFIPAPPPFLFGTLGALIRMRSPARDRNSLFDIAAAGPLAGLLIAIPALVIGLTWSHWELIPGSNAGGAEYALGASLFVQFMAHAVLGAPPAGSLLQEHPTVAAAWVGLFVTALNLIPFGQLDGGRIAYALFGSWHRHVSTLTLAALLLLGFLTGSPNWFVWAALLFLILGAHHQPPLDDLTPLSRGRYAVGVLCFILLVLLLPPVPIIPM